MYYLLIYDVVPDYEERRAQYRKLKARYTKAFLERGELLLAGALADPADRAFVLIQSDSPKTAEDFAKNDPYVTNGLVTNWEVRVWRIVVGAGVEPIQEWKP